MLTLGVAMATRNGMPWLPAQVESILGQSRTVDELVVSDDASTDGTADWVAALAETSAGRIRLLRNDPPLGVTANFERAIRATTTDIVVLSDQDDVWRPDRLAVVDEFASDPELLMISGDARLVDAGGSPIGTLFDALAIDERTVAAVRSGGAFDEYLRRNLATGATMAFRRTLVDRATPFPTSWVHDEWLAMVAAATGRVAMSGELLIDYRQHGSNEIGAESLDLRGQLRRLTVPRGDRNARLLARAEDLAERLAALPGVSPGDRGKARDKVEHERRRSELPAPRLRRVAPVLREWRTGRYRAYGNGSRDVLRDLVQPAGHRGPR